jgi:hypothetical protein
MQANMKVLNMYLLVGLSVATIIALTGREKKANAVKSEAYINQQEVPPSEKVMTVTHLGFPFELRDERYNEFNLRWEAKILLDPAFFSQENLERIFRWYSGRKPNKEEGIYLLLYADIERMLTKEEVCVFYNFQAPNRVMPRFFLFDATFSRETHSLAAGRVCIEYFSISNPDKPTEGKIVILCGSLGVVVESLRSVPPNCGCGPQ